MVIFFSSFITIFSSSLSLSYNKYFIDLKDTHTEDLPHYININQNDFYMRRLVIFLLRICFQLHFLVVNWFQYNSMPADYYLGHLIQLPVFCLLVL